MANTADFIKKITVDKKITATPAGNYSFKNGTIELTSANEDSKIFKELFKVSIDQHTGNGEVALFWLLGGTTKGSRVKATGDGNNPDLSFNNTAIEVKSYSSIDKKFTVGRFTGQTAFREMVSIIFAVSNLASSGSIKSSQSYIDVLNFNFLDLAIAAEHMCVLRSALSGLKKSEKDMFDKLPFLKTIISNIDKFDSVAEKNKLNAVCGYGANRPGGDLIAKELSKFLLKSLLSVKPGEGGYFANVVEKSGGFVIDFVKVDLSKLDNLSQDRLTNGFSANQGQLQISLAKLFK